MKRCRWCSEDATTTVEVEPGDGLKFPITAEACEPHAAAVTADQGPPVDSLRRKHARGVKQLTIFDVPGVGPGSAIHS